MLMGKISSVNIPQGVLTIGNRAFSTSSLSEVTLPETLISIEENAFYGTLLKEIRIPTSVQEIGYCALGSVDFPIADIYGKSGSAAEQYAKEYGINFFDIALPVYELRYDANGGTFDIEPQRYSEGASVIITKSIPIREGYTFLGWTLDGMLNEEVYSPGDEIVLNDTTTLFAVWSMKPLGITLNKTSMMFNKLDTSEKLEAYLQPSGQVYEKVDQAAKTHQHLSLISCGWDPGLFSLARTLFESVLPEGKHYTFWGKGVSQGHSDAIRRIPGVQDARQYTVPVDAAVERARSSERPELTTREMHTRECYVVAKEGADKAKIEKEIKEMPNYFADYDTTVHFISQEELDRDHSGLPHGGFVIRNGNTSDQTTQIAEFKLTLDSNPEFTSSVLVAYARAIYRMAKAGKTGAVSVLDIPFALLSPKDPAELRKELL